MHSKSHPAEVPLNDTDVLLSTTDMDSRITYANSDFCRIAGFSTEDMYGQPHNLVRHPDMPAQAFANMWQTIRAGQSWMGPVKNRCRNGDYYWVNAFVTPIRDSSGNICEYQSVRTKPDPEVIKRAEQTYQQLSNHQGKPQLSDHADALAQLKLGLILLAGLSFLSAFYSELSLYVNWVVGLLAVIMFGVFMRWSARLQSLTEKSRRIFDNPLMSFLYSGHRDSLAAINLALEMQQAQLKAVVGRVNDASLNVCENSASSLQCSDEVSLHLQRQIGEVSQVVAAMEQLSQTIGEISGNVNGAAEVANESEASTFFGKGNVEATIQNIQSLNRDLQLADQQVAGMSKSVADISQALQVIEGIAEQTNLLAVNAAIEAAHSGESGNGFVVVATEVRELANRTQKATDSIKQVLESLSSHSGSARHGMQQALNSSLDCVGLAESCGSSLMTIQNEVSRLADLNRSIAAAIEQQSAVATEVTGSINNIMALASQSGEVSSQAKALNASLMDKVKEQSALIRQFV